VDLLSWIAAGRGEFDRAAILLGVVDTLWSAFGLQPLRESALYRAPYLDCVARTRTGLGAPAYQAAYRRGTVMSLDDAVNYATGHSPTPAPTAAIEPRDERWAALTRRERQVAQLIGEGLTNKQIAGKLVIGTRTAESHVEHILIKLGFSTRAQIAAWAATQPPPNQR
jgi:non-specific serine/threonine protein kinase